MVEEKKSVEKKGFFARILESLDKKMEEKAKSGGCCCCAPKDKDKKGCC